MLADQSFAAIRPDTEDIGQLAHKGFRGFLGIGDDGGVFLFFQDLLHWTSMDFHMVTPYTAMKLELGGLMMHS